VQRAGWRITTAWPYLVAAVAVAVAFRRALFDSGHIPFDLELYYYPLLYTVQDQIASGSLPAWDPYTYGGTPLLANAQSAWLYPPHLLLGGVLALFGKPLTQEMLQWLAALHVWLAAAGTVLLVRARGLGDSAAAFAGVFVVLCGSTVSQAQHLAMIEALAWLPFALVVVDRMRVGPHARHVVALGGLTALMVTAGFVPVMVPVAALVLLYAIAHGPRRVAVSVRAAAGLALGGALAAAALLPAAATSKHAIDLEAHGAVLADTLASAIVPNVFGHWLDSIESFTGIAPGLTNTYYYVGAGAIVAFPLALGAGRRALADLLVAAALLLLTFGTLAAEAASAIHGIGTLGLLHRPELYVYVAAVPLALVLAHGVARPPSARQLAMVVPFLALLALIPYGNGKGATLHFPADAPRRTLLVIALLCGLATLAFAAGRRAGRERIAAAAMTAFALLAAAELTSTVPDRYFVVTPSPATSASADRTSDGLPIVAELKERLRPGERVQPATRDLQPDWAGFTPVWRLEAANGFHPTLSRHMADRLERAGSEFPRASRIFDVTPRELPFLREMGVRFVVVPKAKDPFADRPGYPVAYEDAYYRVHELPNRPRRAFAVARTCAERRGPDGLGACPAATAAVSFPDEEQRRYELAAGAGPRTLVTGEPWWPGWRAEVNGDAADVRRAGYLAVIDVPAGASQVTLSYRPPLFVLGAVVSLLALAGSVAVLVRDRRAARRASA
jgi:hypothetical protein